MRRLTLLSVAAVAASSVAFGVMPALSTDDASVTPVKCEAGDTTVDGRVFPEPTVSATYLTFAEFECGISLLVEQNPDRLRVDVVLEAGDKAEGPVYDVVMSDFTVEGPKEQLLVMSSIHGNEIGPREGAARQIEDMLGTHAFTDIDDDQLDVDRLLAEFEIHWVFPNPEGWIRGEGPADGNLFGTYARAEHDGKDLNRNFPVKGFFAYNSAGYFEEEGIAVRELLQDGFRREQDGTSQGWDLGTDNHGQIYDTYLAAGLQIVGQFDFQKSERLATFADRIDDEMANYMATAAFAELQLALQAQGRDIAGGYRWGTLYDILGYSASGSGIDYYNTPGEVEGVGFATELTVSNQPAANVYTYSGPVVQVWVDSIRAINNAMFKEALAENDGERRFTFELDGDVAYILDPARITHDDDNGRGSAADAQNAGGHELQPYDVSRMDFFAELAPLASTEVVPVTVAEIESGAVDLASFTAVIAANDAMPEPAADEAAYFGRLRAYAEAGGTLILTDAALQSLPRIADGFTSSDVTVVKNYVGAVGSFTSAGGELNAGLRGIASQTYDTVPLGYNFGGSNNSAPNWRVATSKWNAAGGITAGTTSSQTIYGELPLGEGRVRILGALLPDPTEAYYHPFGLQDYAVTYTGYTLLQNMVNAG